MYHVRIECFRTPHVMFGEFVILAIQVPFKQLITLIIMRSFILRSKIRTSLGKKQAVFGIRFPPRKKQVYISVPILLNITYFSRQQYIVSRIKKTMMRMGYSPKLKEKTSNFNIINLFQICISCRRID